MKLDRVKVIRYRLVVCFIVRRERRSLRRVKIVRFRIFFIILNMYIVGSSYLLMMVIIFYLELGCDRVVFFLVFGVLLFIWMVVMVMFIGLLFCKCVIFLEYKK